MTNVEGRILEAARESRYKGTSVRLLARREWVLKEKSLQPRILHPVRVSLISVGLHPTGPQALCLPIPETKHEPGVSDGHQWFNGWGLSHV